MIKVSVRSLSGAFVTYYNISCFFSNMHHSTHSLTYLLNISHKRPHNMPNEMLFFHTGGHLAILIENSSDIFFCLFSFFYFKLQKQNKIGSIMGSCYSGDHIAEGHTHTDITTCNIEEPQKKYRLGTVSNRFQRGVERDMIYWIQTLTLCFCRELKIWSA